MSSQKIYAVENEKGWFIVLGEINFNNKIEGKILATSSSDQMYSESVSNKFSVMLEVVNAIEITESPKQFSEIVLTRYVNDFPSSSRNRIYQDPGSYYNLMKKNIELLKK